MYESLCLHLASRIYKKSVFNISDYSSFLLGSVYSRKNNLSISLFNTYNSFDQGVALHNFLVDYLKTNSIPFEYYHSMILDLDYIREDVLNLYDLELKYKEKTAFKNIVKLMSSPVPLILIPDTIKQDYLIYLDNLIKEFKKATM